MIFVHQDICVMDGEMPEEVGIDILNALRSFIKVAPQEYLREYITNLSKDLFNPNSFLYASDKKASKNTYWFDVLRCELVDESVLSDEDFNENLKNYEWYVYYEESET